jgi:signal transduction histidine kinase
MLIQIRQEIVASGVVALTVGLFIVDLHTPLGIASQVLYIGPVLLALFSPHRWFPVIVASLVTILTAFGAVLSPRPYDIPSWVPFANRAFSMVVIWTPVWYFSQRRKLEEQLRQLNEELELRVLARTRELAAVNESLVAEVSERMRTEQSLEANRRELRQLASQLLLVQEAERRRISRDLHDDINQQLALLAVDIEALERQLSDAPVGTLRAARAIQDRVVEISENVRHMAYQFHPSILDDLGLPIALQRLVNDFSVRTGVNGVFLDHGTPMSLPQDVGTCLYRVAQESLGNISRHAKAEHVSVDLARSRKGLQLMISDDGVGFSPNSTQQNPRGLGLLSMKERITLVDGTLDIQSSEGLGTRLCAWVPLKEEEGE